MPVCVKVCACMWGQREFVKFGKIKPQVLTSVTDEYHLR